MKITRELIIDLLNNGNVLKVLSIYANYENGNYKYYLAMGNLKAIVHLEICEN